MTTEELLAIVEKPEAASVEQLSAAHARLDEEIAQVRRTQMVLHAVQTAKEDEAARAARAGRDQKVGG